VILRQLELADIPAMLQIQSEAYAPLLCEPAGAFEDKLSLFPRGAFGCFEDRRMCGYAVTLAWRGDGVAPLGEALFRLPEDPDTLFVHDVATSPAHRGKGVARRLVERAFAIASEMSIDRFSLVAVQDAEPFWARFGFQPVESLLYAPGVPATRMILKRPAR
jgi:GNAT superfamily N-acetyltransferase